MADIPEWISKLTGYCENIIKISEVKCSQILTTFKSISTVGRKNFSRAWLATETTDWFSMKKKKKKNYSQMCIKKMKCDYLFSDHPSEIFPSIPSSRTF